MVYLYGDAIGAALVAAGELVGRAGDTLLDIQSLRGGADEGRLSSADFAGENEYVAGFQKSGDFGG